MSFEIGTIDRRLQQDFLCERLYNHIKTAAKMGWHEDSFLRCLKLHKPFPANKLAALYNATGDIRFPRAALTGTDLIVMKRPHGKGRSAMDALADLQARLAKLTSLAAKRERGESLTDEEKEAVDQECAELIQSASDLHEALVED